jgi:hypothetical protein
MTGADSLHAPDVSIVNLPKWLSLSKKKLPHGPAYVDQTLGYRINSTAMDHEIDESNISGTCFDLGVPSITVALQQTSRSISLIDALLGCTHRSQMTYYLHAARHNLG